MNEVLFDLAREGYTGWTAAGPAVAIAVVALVLALVTRGLAGLKDLRKLWLFHLAMIAAAAGGTLGTLIILRSTWNEYRYLMSAEESKKSQVISGKVAEFVAEGPQRRPRESFSVGGEHFEYSSNDVTSAYHRTMPAGGRIREGMSVTIHEVDGKIVRLERIATRVP